MTPATRELVGALIDRLIAILDADDGDPDLEPEPAEESDTGIADLDALLTIEARQ